MRIYFPTTDFLGRIEITNQGKWEGKYSSEQLFFNLLNNPGYSNNRLISNFNNKIGRFIENQPEIKEKIKQKRVCFYEYATLSYQKPGEHKEIAQGMLSWTLAYYLGALASIYETVKPIKGRYEHVVATGDIGNFTDWKEIGIVNEIRDKLKVSIREFYYHPELREAREVLWVMKWNVQEAAE